MNWRKRRGGTAESGTDVLAYLSATLSGQALNKAERMIIFLREYDAVGERKWSNGLADSG
nr:hypothetical protein [Evansella caseinilytica]